MFRSMPELKFWFILRCLLKITTVSDSIAHCTHKKATRNTLHWPYGDLFRMSTFILSPSHAFHLHTNFCFFFHCFEFRVSSIKWNTYNVQRYILESDDWKMETTIGIAKGFFVGCFRFNNNKKKLKLSSISTNCFE